MDDEDLFGQPVVDNEFVQQGFSSHLDSFGLGDISSGISGVVCNHQNIFFQAVPRLQTQIIEMDKL